MPKFTAKQRKFINFYDGNATQAAIQAGYAKITSRVTGHRLLTNANIKQAIKERQDKEDAPIIASRQDRQKFWSETMNKSAGVDMNDRIKCSELLGKSEGDFTEKIQHSGGVSVAMGRIKKGGKDLAFKVGSPVRPS